MAKIDFQAASLLNSVLQGGNKSSAKKPGERGDLQLHRKAPLPGSGIFSEMLDNSARTTGDLGPLRELSPSEEALTELMDAVHSAGSDLIDRPFPDEILRYKKSVRNFVHYILENGYDLLESQGIKKKVVIRGETEWKSKVYHSIKVIDQKLEELAAAVLSGQADKLEKVSKLDEITGLLIDLTVTGVIKERDG